MAWGCVKHPFTILWSPRSSEESISAAMPAKVGGYGPRRPGGNLGFRASSWWCARLLWFNFVGFPIGKRRMKQTSPTSIGITYLFGILHPYKKPTPCRLAATTRRYSFWGLGKPSFPTQIYESLNGWNLNVRLSAESVRLSA